MATGAVLQNEILSSQAIYTYSLWILVLALVWKDLRLSATALLIGAIAGVPLVGVSLVLVVSLIAFAGLVAAYATLAFSRIYVSLVIGWGLFAFVWLIVEDPSSRFTDLWLVVPLFAVPVLGAAFLGLQFRRTMARRRAAEGDLVRTQAEYEAAIAEQRRELARDLHDIVAHELTLIRTQVQAVDGLTAEPDVQQALNNVSEASKSALEDLRRLLTLLGQAGSVAHESSDAPEVSLVRGIERFSQSLRESGYDVITTMDHVPAGIPQSVQVGLYRVLQECATNIIKHGEQSAETTGPDCVIEMRASGSEVMLEITNRAAPQDQASLEEGLGLHSCRERVEALGGHFEAGAVSDQRWRTRAEVILS